MRTLAEAVTEIAKTIQNNEKFSVPALAARAYKAAQANPHDAPVVIASNVLVKMASDNQLFISRSELNRLYDQLYANNTKLKELFAEELGRAELERPKMMVRANNESAPLTDDYAKIADPVLVNALTAALSGEKEERLYSKEIAAKAEKVCAAELEVTGLPPKAVDVFAGRNDVIICRAVYETPKGQSHVLVPVEVQDGRALFPNMFLSQAGFAPLDVKTLQQHIVNTAGQSFRVDGEKLLEVLADAKGRVKSDVDAVDLAMIRLRAESGTPAEHTLNGILYQKVDEPIPYVQDPEIQPDPEIQSFAQKLSNPAGIAKYLFGDAAVDKGKGIVSRKLASFGYPGAQIAVADCDEDTIYYAAKLGAAAGISVPVKVKDGLALPPSIALASGKVAEFTQTGVSELISQPDAKVLAVASPSYGLKPSELLDQVRQAIAEGNLLKAEDAIDVLSETDEKSAKLATALLIESFSNGISKTASDKSSCTMVVKNSSSQHELCGHLNLPLHKVYQNQHGECCPLYRKGMDESSEGGTFMASKIILT